MVSYYVLEAVATLILVLLTLILVLFIVKIVLKIVLITVAIKLILDASQMQRWTHRRLSQMNDIVTGAFTAASGKI